MKKLRTTDVIAYGLSFLVLGVVDTIAVVVIVAQTEWPARVLTALTAGSLVFVYNVLAICLFLGIRRTQIVLRSKGR